MGLERRLDTIRTEIERQIGEHQAKIRELQAELSQIALAEAAIGVEQTLEVRLGLRVGSIKEAAVGVLRHYPDGLTTDEIIGALALAGKIVLRSSLTPQLSRLKDVGALTQINSRWILVTEPAS